MVLISADDVGAPRRQYDLDDVGARALQFRPRQNVLLELGFFYGHLGFERVHIIRKPPDRPFPNFEMPSDMGGVVIEEASTPGWERRLLDKLEEHGFQIRSADRCHEKLSEELS